MNFLSLPDEMLAVVARHLNQSILVQIRKTNQRMNNISNRAGICKKLEVEEIRIDGENFKLRLDINLANSYGLEHNEFLPRENFSCHSDLFKYILPKIKVTDKFEYSFTEQFDNDAFLTLQQNKNSVRNCEILRYFCGPNYGLSIENENKILTLFPKCRRFISSLPRHSANAFSSRNWKYIVIDSSDALGHLDETLNDNFLSTIVPRCEEFLLRSANGVSYFTFAGIVELLENLSSELPSRARWILGPIDIYERDVEESFQKLKSIPNQNMEMKFGKNISVELTLLKYLGNKYNNFMAAARLKSIDAV